MNLQFRNVTINRGRIYVELEQGRNVDITGGLTDPAAAIDLMMASERMRQIAERNARLREFAAECREDAIRGARI
jgi:hypothetical protein